ncbi:MAG: TonB-dependent receptor [Gammaproteobacteria bacterium]|nr:TonB-dependent receptor [Gammaproteobacteria bacterium]
MWLVLAIGSAPSVAAELEEIIVTARKLEESLQETPVAVSAFTSSDLDARSITQLNDVQRFTPNLTFFPSGIMGSTSGQAYIRGVGQFDYYFSADPGVGVYIDGVYLGRSLGNLLDIVDVERIEVLRGPQGTLYGKNTIGGAINVITRKPQGELAGYVDVKTGSYDRVNARANVSFPIIAGQLAGKIAVGTRNADGYGVRPRVGDDPGEEDANVVQSQLSWTPQENFDALVSFDYTRVDSQLGVHHVEQFTNPPLVGLYNALASPPLAGLHGVAMGPFDSRYYSHDPYVTFADGSNIMEHDIWGVSAVLNWDPGPVAVKSTTAYRNLDQIIGIDPDGSPEQMIDEVDRIDQEQISQELQLSGLLLGDRLKWVGGFYFMNEKSNSDSVVMVATQLFPALEGLPAPIIPLGPWACPQPPGSPLPCLGGAGNPFNVIFDLPQRNTGTQETNSYAIYAQGNYAFTDQLTGTFGVRYTRDEKDFTTQSLRLRTPIPLLPFSEQSDSWSDTSPRFGLDYKWTEDLLMYFSIAKGFKSGGFNGRARNTAELEGFNPEKILSYEIGMKSEWFDRRVRLNVAGFYNEYDDIQLTEQGLDPATGTQTIITRNAGDGEIRGFEIELDAVPFDAVHLNASLGHLDAEYVRISPAAAASGLTLQHKLIGTPKWTASVSGEYTIPVIDWGNLSLRADYSYRAKTYFQLLNVESVAQPGYGLVNLRAAFDSADERWTIATGVTNATNDRYRSSGVSVGDSLGFNVGWYGRPREWFLQGIYRF